jgi:hypothetical protein
MIRYHKTVPERYTVNLVELSVGDFREIIGQ